MLPRVLPVLQVQLQAQVLRNQLVMQEQRSRWVMQAQVKKPELLRVLQ